MSALVVWRLCAAQYAATAFSGVGAKLFGGRWSPAGVPVAYTSESRALAVVEILANVEDPATLLAAAWVLVPAELAPEQIERPARVPESWRQFPHPIETQLFGAEWVRAGRRVALRVPSAVVPGEFNYLINPVHPDFQYMRFGPAEPFSFDARRRPMT